MNLDKLEKLEISNRAKKKLELRDYLLAHPESTPLAALLEHYSREQVNFFVEQGALTILQKEVQRSAAYFEGIESNQALELNPEQKLACEAVVGAIGKKPSSISSTRNHWKWENRGLPADYPRCLGYGKNSDCSSSRDLSDTSNDRALYCSFW